MGARATFLRISNWPWDIFLWIGALCSVAGMAIFFPVGWDLVVIQQAMKDLRHGLDPYAAELARISTINTAGHAYNFYVYPPITLKLLQLVNAVPAAPGYALYWLVYAAGFACQLWAGVQLAQPGERRILKYFLPLVAFFPAFMPNEVILCGNVAIPIYGAALAASIWGWKKDQWLWFYIVVLAASLFKPPFLVLLAIPLFAGRAQTLKSMTAAAAGLSLFAAQRLLWPTAFLEYLRAVQVENVVGNSAGHLWSLGFSAAGVLAAHLQTVGKPYTVPAALFLLAYGGTLFLALGFFGWHYRRGRITPYTWMAVLWLGTLLMNPHILQYDALAATVPMFLLVLRGWNDATGRWIVGAGLVGAAAAFAANHDGLEISVAMWSLLVAGLLGLARELSLATMPASAPFGEPVKESLSSS